MMTYPTPWMSRAQKVVVGVFAVAGLAMVIACGGGSKQQITPSQFKSYPRSEALDLVIGEHVNAGREPSQKRILLTTWFQDGLPEVAQFCSVRETGECRRWQYVHTAEMGLRSRPRIDLPPETMSAILKAISELPPTEKPPLENMIIVSFWKDGVWETRLYDRKNRPAPVSTIFGMTNAQIVP